VFFIAKMCFFFVQGGGGGGKKNAITLCRYTCLLQAGARSGCSVSASRKCKPPWWKRLLVVVAAAPPTDYEERSRCEEREMAACLEAAREACAKFAKAKCAGPFQDARIAHEGVLANTGFDVWGAAADKSSSTAAAAACALNGQPPRV
jgi:hypothetical protein